MHIMVIYKKNKTKMIKILNVCDIFFSKRMQLASSAEQCYAICRHKFYFNKKALEVIWTIPDIIQCATKDGDSNKNS